MKKYKTLLIGLSIIAGVIALLSILSFTLFGLHSVELDFRNETTLFDSDTSKSDIIESADFKYGECIFFSNKQNYISNLEKRNPYIKIISIETKFPNKLIVHCAQREEHFAIKGYSNETIKKYFVCDSNLKILNILTYGSDDNYYCRQSNAILLDGEINIKNNDATAGDYLELNNSEVIENINPALLANNRNIGQQKALFKSLTVTYNQIGQVEFTLFDYNNFKIVIKNSNKLLPQKFQAIFSAFSDVSPSEYSTHYFLVTENTNNEILIYKSSIN